MTNINTRIALKTDETSAWNDSQLKLMRGELAIEQLSTGQFKLHVGQGEKTFNQIKNDIVIDADNVIGLNESINALSTSFYEVSSLDELSTKTLKTGDVAVVVSTIANDKKSHTAYVYDSSLSSTPANGWRAMDGNYSAQNVFINEDISAVGSFNSIGNIDNGTTLSAGQSIQDILVKLFMKELEPTVSNPSIQFYSTSATGEVGSTFKRPAATLSIKSIGTYSYGTKATNVTTNTGVKFNNVTISSDNAGITTAVTSSITDAELTTNNTYIMSADTSVSSTYKDTTTTFKFTVSATHTSGDVPVTNIGNERAAKAIQSATLTASYNATFTGWRRMFIGCVTDADAEINETLIKGLSYREKYVAGDIRIKPSGGTVKLQPGVKKIVVALPKGKTIKSAILESSLNAPITSDYKKQEVDVSGATSGNDMMTYNVYVYQPASIDPSEEHLIVVG